MEGFTIKDALRITELPGISKEDKLRLIFHLTSGDTDPEERKICLEILTKGMILLQTQMKNSQERELKEYVMREKMKLDAAEHDLEMSKSGTYVGEKSQEELEKELLACKQKVHLLRERFPGVHF